MEKILKILTKDIGWKFLSLLLATILWLVGINNYDPTIMQDYNIRLTVLNKDVITNNGLVLLNEGSLEASMINVTFRGRRSQIANLTNVQNNIVAYIDLSPIDILNTKDIGEPKNAVVKVKLPDSLNQSSYERVNVYPDTKSVTLDFLASEYIEVQAVQLGKVEEGYIAMDSIVTPSEILVSGAKSIVEKIDSVRVEVDIKDKMLDFTESYEPKIYDENGKEISNLKKDVESVQVTVPIKKYARIPISTPTITGTIPEGHEIVGVSLEPKYVEVVGTGEDISLIPRINLEPIVLDEDGLSKEYDLRGYLRETKLSIKTGTPQEVVVTVNVESQEVRAYDIESSQIEIINSNSDVLIPEIISVNIRGLKSKLDELTDQDISVKIDLADLEEGEHNILADISVPDGVFVEGNVEILVSIPNANAEIETSEDTEIEETDGTENDDVEEIPEESEDLEEVEEIKETEETEEVQGVEDTDEAEEMN